MTWPLPWPQRLRASPPSGPHNATCSRFAVIRPVTGASRGPRRPEGFRHAREPVSPVRRPEESSVGATAFPRGTRARPAGASAGIPAERSVKRAAAGAPGTTYP
jgi:hypothetical protein